jgi:hypothetical protein
VHHGIEKATDVDVAHPVHPASFQPHRKRIQRIMRGTPRAAPIRKTREVSCINRIPNLYNRALDDFIFQGGVTQRPLPPLGCGYVAAPCRLRLVRASLQSCGKPPKGGLQMLPILLPRHSVHARSCGVLQTAIGPPQGVQRR